MLPPPILVDRDIEDVYLLPTYKPWVKLSPKAIIEWFEDKLFNCRRVAANCVVAVTISLHCIKFSFLISSSKVSTDSVVNYL